MSGRHGDSRRPALDSVEGFIGSVWSNAIRAAISTFFIWLFISFILFGGFSLWDLVLGIFIGDQLDFIEKIIVAFVKSTEGLFIIGVGAFILYMLEDMGLPGPKKLLGALWDMLPF
jgi:hypothetical protein